MSDLLDRLRMLGSVPGLQTCAEAAARIAELEAANARLRTLLGKSDYCEIYGGDGGHTVGITFKDKADAIAAFEMVGSFQSDKSNCPAE